MINQYMIIGKIEEGDVETAKSMLLQFPKDASVCSGDPWLQIAHKCVEHKQTEVLELMLENGYKLHGCGGSLLQLALHECDENMVKFLIEKGADSRDPTLLHQACEMGWSTMVEILLKNGSNVSWRTEATPQAMTMGRKNENLSALQVAARGAHFLDTSKYVHLAKLLIKNGADVKELQEVTYGGTLKRLLKETEEHDTIKYDCQEFMAKTRCIEKYVYEMNKRFDRLLDTCQADVAVLKTRIQQLELAQSAAEGNKYQNSIQNQDSNYQKKAIEEFMRLTAELKLPTIELISIVEMLKEEQTANMFLAMNDDFRRCWILGKWEHVKSSKV